MKPVSFAEVEPRLGHVPHSDIGGDRHVTFESTLPADANDTDQSRDIFVRDLQTGAVILVTAMPSGGAGHGKSAQYQGERL